MKILRESPRKDSFVTSQVERKKQKNGRIQNRRWGLSFQKFCFVGRRKGITNIRGITFLTDSFSLFKAEIAIKKKKRIVPEFLNILSLGKELDYPQKIRGSFVY